ncbi:MAG: nitrilase-related carbon-nitrogen hydrolase [Candidatus Cloacimonadota bacterium]|nr:nitrilase-related carbon-nitrogen hydrolase [Candidatus Cloacimonadota bacterium]
MKVGFLQFYPKLFHEKHNLEKIETLLQGCKTDLVVLPELATSGYLFTNQKEMEPLSAPAKSGRIADFFRNISARENCSIVSGFLEKEANSFYNSQMLVQPNGKIEIYRKTHLFFDEKELFKPGNTGFNIFEFNGTKLGLMICFDWIFPESARTLALKGAEIICHSANLVLPFCQKAMITRSVENRIFTITANRIGTEKNETQEFTFTGMSQITSPKGEILAQAKGNEEVLEVVEINPAEARDKFVTEKNDIFADRKREFYKI